MYQHIHIYKQDHGILFRASFQSIPCLFLTWHVPIDLVLRSWAASKQNINQNYNIFTCCTGRVQLCVCFYLLMSTYEKGIFQFQNVRPLFLLFSVIFFLTHLDVADTHLFSCFYIIYLPDMPIHNTHKLS